MDTLLKVIRFVSAWSWTSGEKTYYKIKFILKENESMYESFINKKLFDKIQTENFVSYNEYMAAFNVDKNLTLRIADIG